MSSIESEKYILNIYIKNSKPVALSDLTKSMNGISYFYASFIEKNGFRTDHDPRLYIKEIKNGSIEMNLVTGLPVTIIGIAQQISMPIEFIKTYINCLLYFLGKSQELLISLTKKDCDALRDSVEIVAKDIDSYQITSAKNIHGNIYNGFTFNINSQEANCVQNSVTRYKEEELSK